MKNIYLFLISVIFISCDEDSAQDIKYGKIVNACGPSDAPVVRVYLADEPMDCSEDVRNFPNVNAYLEFSEVANIGVGMILEPHKYGNTDSGQAFECDVEFENCLSIGSLSVEITSQDSTQLLGIYTLIDGVNTESKKFVINACADDRPICG